MRKFLLFFIIAPLGLFAQNANTDVAPRRANNLIGITDKTPVKIPVSNLTAKTQIPGTESYSVLPTDTYNMGVTVYDLQTNASDARRIIVYPNGDITAVWTTSPSFTDPNFVLRGTGYNHYNANSSTWLLGAGNLTQPVEPKNVHSGWPNPCIDSIASPVHEFCISHSPNGVIQGITTSTLQRIDNQAIGNNTWTQTTISNAKTNSPLWPRVAQSGKYTYMIANFDDQESPGDTPNINGIKDPAVYYLSTDGGITWSSPTTLPGYDTSGNIGITGTNPNEVFGSADNYAIDAQDSTVAIVIGGYFADVSLWKSTDYGKTFRKTIIDTCQTRRFHGKIYNVPGDTLLHFANDGSVNVILDKNDSAHVFYGVRGIRYPKDSPTYYAHNEGWNGILHWDQRNHHKTIIGYSPDLNKNDNLDVGFGFEGVSSSGAIYYEYGSDGLTSMPTSTIDGQGNIYCVYSVYMESFDSTASTPTEIDENSVGGSSLGNYLHYRDLYITYSKDGGNTWASEQNITKTPFAEEVFPSLARNTSNSDTKLHLEYMYDTYASDYVAGLNSTLVTRQVNPSYNNIMYMGINITDVTSGNFGAPENYEGIESIQKNPLFSVGDIYPNPSAQGNVNVAITMNHADNGSIEIYDIAGNLMSTQVLGTLNYGKQIKSINTEGLSAGMYFVKINAGGYTTVNKLVIQ